MIDKLYKTFSTRSELPIEVEEIRDEIVRLGVQDQIIISPEDTAPQELKGLIYRYTVSTGPYADPEFHTIIVCSENEPIEMQRLTCAKEMVHLCENGCERTNAPDEIDGLISKLLGPLTTDDFGVGDFMASLDRLGLYRGLALLFPLAAREDALKALDETMSLDDIAAQACIPSNLVQMVLSEEWLKMLDILFDEVTD